VLVRLELRDDLIRERRRHLESLLDRRQCLQQFISLQSDWFCL